MKKVASLFAVLAVVVTLFAPAFAISPPPEPEEYHYNVKLDNDFFPQNAGGVICVTGAIRDENNAIVDENLEIVIEGGSEGDEYHSIARSGIIDVELPGDLPVGNYEIDVVGEDAQTAEFDISFELVTDFEMDFTWGEDDDFLMAGTIKDFYVGGPNYVDLVYLDDEGCPCRWIAWAEVSSSGNFAMLLPKSGEGSPFFRTGTIALYAWNLENCVKIAEGEISPAELTVTNETGDIVYTLAQDVIFDVPDKDDLYIYEEIYYDLGIYEDDYNWVFSIPDYDAEGDLVLDGTWDGTNYIVSFDDDANPIFTKGQKGTWDVQVEYRHCARHSFYEGSTTLTVVKPDRYNLLGWDDEIGIDEANPKIKFGKTLRVVEVLPNGESNDATEYIITASGAEAQFKVRTDDTPWYDLAWQDELDEVSFLPPGDGEPGDKLLIKPTRAGIINFTIVAMDGSAEMATFERQIKVNGAVADLNITELEVETEAIIVVTVVDEDGVPINNASIFFESQDGNSHNFTVNAAHNQNIINGMYEYDVTFDDPGEINFTLPTSFEVKVKNGDNKVIGIAGTLEVVGHPVYEVNLDADTYLAGLEETVVVSMVDEEGDYVFPDYLAFDSEEIDLEEATKVDTDDDDIMDSYRVTVPAFTKAGEYKVVGTTDNGVYRGETGFEVVAPKLVVRDDVILTDNFATTIALRLIDPRDDSILELFEDWDVWIDESDVDWVMAVGDEPDPELTDDEWYELTLAIGVDWDAFEEGEMPVFDSWIADRPVGDCEVEGSIPIEKAMMTIAPETIVIGQAANLGFTLVDAMGNPLEGYAVHVEDTDLETNENGQVFYNVAAAGSKIEFVVDTDTEYLDGDLEDETVQISKALRPIYDNEPPTVEAPTEIDVDTATIVIRDNIRLARVKVDEEEITIFPVPEVSYTVSLEEGVNTFRVQAMDRYYNVMDEDVTITYTPPAPVVEVIIGTDISGWGAPYLAEDDDGHFHTMVPVRVATLLGATMEWDSATKTVTYTLGDITISLTVGELVATVNGQEVTLPVAPWQDPDTGRVFVPIRMVAQELGFTVNWTSEVTTIQ